MAKKLLLLSSGTSPSDAGGDYLAYAGKWLQQHFGASPEDPKKILFVPYAKEEHEQVQYGEMARAALKPLGINIIYPKPSEDPIQLLGQSQGVLVGGGSTFPLLDKLQKTGLGDAIKKTVDKGMPYAGESAGTNVAGINIRTTNDMHIIDIKSLDGMNLAPFLFNPHHMRHQLYFKDDKGQLVPFKPSQASRIKEYHKVPENDLPVVGLPEGTGLLITDNKVTKLGEEPVMLFRKDEPPMELNEGHVLSAYLNSPSQSVASAHRACAGLA